jgi:two-component system, NarL family, nitrate/nitrite response regulator NarL
MLAVHTAVRVLVVGPHDLVTTAVVAALRTHGLHTQEWGSGALPPAPHSGGLAVVSTPVRSGVVERAVRSGWQVVAVVAPGDSRATAAAVAAGAAAVIPRSAPLDDLLHAVDELAAGRPGMSAQERTALLELHRSTQVLVEVRRRQLDALTDREFEVLQRLERGQRAADIARDAVVATSTVRTHIRSILEKLKVHSQHQAVEVYREVRRHAG